MNTEKCPLIPKATEVCSPLYTTPIIENNRAVGCLTLPQPQLLDHKSHKDVRRVCFSFFFVGLFFICWFGFGLVLSFGVSGVLQASRRIVALRLWSSYSHILAPASCGSCDSFALIFPSYGTKLLHVALFFSYVTFICMSVTQHMCRQP